MSEKQTESHKALFRVAPRKAGRKKAFRIEPAAQKQKWTRQTRKKNAAKAEAGRQSGAPATESPTATPTLEQLEKELEKSRYRVGFLRVVRNTVLCLVVVAAVSALIAMLFLPVLQIHGASMTPTLEEKDIVVAIGVGKCRQGDLIAFYYNNNILIKRVIATAGDWVEIDDAGNVSVNGQPLEEPYLTEKYRGDCDITFPYQVPDGRYFVMGDHRDTSIDSRSSLVGCISGDMVIGRIVLRVWPLNTVRFFGG